MTLTCKGLHFHNTQQPQGKAVVSLEAPHSRPQTLHTCPLFSRWNGHKFVRNISCESQMNSCAIPEVNFARYKTEPRTCGGQQED